MSEDNWKLRLRIFRRLIDFLDSLIMKLLSWRTQVCKRIGKIKLQRNLPIHVPEREAQIIKSKQELAKRYGLAADWVVHLFQVIMHESKRIQNERRIP